MILSKEANQVADNHKVLGHVSDYRFYPVPGITLTTLDLLHLVDFMESQNETYEGDYPPKANWRFYDVKVVKTHGYVLLTVHIASGIPQVGDTISFDNAYWRIQSVSDAGQYDFGFKYNLRVKEIVHTSREKCKNPCKEGCNDGSI